MAVTVVLFPEGHELPENAPRLTFDGPRIVLGRGRDSDVRLPDARVARRHATIRAENGGYSLHDEGSLNGTHVAGARLAAGTGHVLRDGDFVRVGPYWIQVRIDPSLPTKDAAAAARNLALDLVRRRLEAAGTPTVPKVHAGEADDAPVLSVEEEGRAYIVGRAPGSDLVLTGSRAGDRHVYITRRGFSVHVRDGGSAAGCMLGGEPLPRDREALWKPGVPLVCGPATLALEDAVTTTLAALEDAPEAPLAAGEVPAKPLAATPPPPPEPPAPVEPVAPAPIASVRAMRRERSWSTMDLGVLFLALIVLVLSAVGLVWLLKK